MKTIITNLLNNTTLGYWKSLIASPWTIIVNILDIAIVAVLIYLLIKALAGTKIMTLIRGVIFFILLKFIIDFIGLTTLAWLMNQVLTYGVIAIVIIFAPEIRNFLEKFGRTTNLFTRGSTYSEEEKMVQAFLKAVDYMSPRKIGALVSIERTQTLQEYISTGISLDADITGELLINIFIPNTPLHDGAVIIKDGKIAVTCAYLPLTESTTISKEFGTRHRAAIGLSEVSDAFTFIVSEETGGISVTYDGKFRHDLTREEFEQILRQIFIENKSDNKSSLPFFFGGDKK